MDELKISRKRLLETIAVSAAIGATANGGLHRSRLLKKTAKCGNNS